jgi:hypothetical protein
MALVQSCVSEAQVQIPVMKNQWLATLNTLVFRNLHQSPLDELEHHGKGGLVRQTTFRTDRSMAHGRERTFDGIRGA